MTDDELGYGVTTNMKRGWADQLMVIVLSTSPLPLMVVGKVWTERVVWQVER